MLGRANKVVKQFLPALHTPFLFHEDWLSASVSILTASLTASFLMFPFLLSNLPLISLSLHCPSLPFSFHMLYFFITYLFHRYCLKEKKRKQTLTNKEPNYRTSFLLTATLKITSLAWSIPAPAGCLSCWCKLKHLSGKHHLLFCACSVLREIDFISLSL